MLECRVVLSIKYCTSTAITFTIGSLMMIAGVLWMYRCYLQWVKAF